MTTSVLHLIPGLTVGGGARGVLAAASASSLADDDLEHRIVSVKPAHPGLAEDARRRGIEVQSAPSASAIAGAIESADAVVLGYWNSPELSELLELELPAMRLLLWPGVVGSSPPQVLPRTLLRGADLIVPSSEPGARAIRALLGPDGGPPVAEMIPPIGGWDRVEGVERSDRPGFNIGYLGVVGFVKMHPRFAEISAAVRVPEARFIVGGSGDAERRLAHQIAALGAGDRFELLGHVEEIGALMADLDVFGYPLRLDTYTNSDLVLKEAMYSGVPPVVLPDGSSDRLVADGETGVVATDVDSYAPAIEALFEDPAERRRLGANAREHARATWSPSAVAPAWARVYERLLAMPKRARPPLLPAQPDSAAARRFLRGLGGGEELEAGVDVPSESAAAAADRLIAAGTPSVGLTDGGLLDYRRRYPDDALLALWAGLFLREQGHPALAAAELARAGELGCPRWRLDAHSTEAVPG